MNTPDPEPPGPATQVYATDAPNRTAEAGTRPQLLPPEPAVPGRYPGYEIEAEIGRGAWGVVYRARALGLGRPVALKVVAAGTLADADHAVRFLEEGRIIAKLDHPQIIRVFDVGRAADHLYLALELAGGSLAARLRGQPLAPDEAAGLVEKIARGTGYAHRQGVVHRDIKPANVLLTAAGEPKLADFGLAKQLELGPGVTASGDILGTPAYMAPEQARGERDVTPAADVYALGAILYECLTGRPPLIGETAAHTLLMVAEQEPASPRSLNALVPPDLTTIALKCLEKDPARRYASADDLADDLRHFRAGEPIAARPVGGLERTWRWCRRNPRVAGLLGAVAALLVVLAVGASAAAVLLRGERDAARAAQGRAVAAEVGRRNELVRAYIQDARVSRASGQVGRRLRGLEAVRGILRAVPSDELTAERRGELRDEAVASMALSDLREAAGAGDLNFLTVDADPTLNLIAGIAFEGSPHLCVRRRDGGSVLRLPPPPGEVRIFAAGFEPTARWLAELVAYSRADGKDRFRVWEGQDGWRQARCVIDETVGVGGRKCWAFHPDGRHLVFVAADAVLRRYDLTDPGRVERSEPRYRSCDPSYSPDGRTLALANPDGIAEFVDAASLRPAGTVTGVGRTNATAWGDTGRFVAFGEVHGAVYLWDVEARAGRYVAGRHGGRVLNIAFGPGGTRFATSADDHETRVWDCRTGGELQRLRGRLIRWAADGRLAVADDRKLTVYEPVGGQLATAPVLAATAEFSPDGRWLAASSAGGVELFAGDTLAPVANLGLDECGPPAFRPDGGELLTFGRFSHVQRWPLAAGNPARLGPARPYPLDFQSKLLGALVEAPQHAGRHAAWSRNGKTLAIVDYRNHRLLVADGTNPDAAPRELTKFFNAQLVAVSPDGAYVACGDLLWSTVAVWRVADGQEVFRVPGHGFAAFDPTGRLLVTGGPLEYRAERVGTWEPVWAVTRDESDRGYAAPAAFAPDGKTVALAPDRRHVRLCAADSGATLATLTHPEPAIPMWLAFAPDGARLAVARTGVDLAVWDLVALRRGLADLGLDWPGDHATSAATRSGALEVVRGSRLPAAEEWPRRWRKMGVYEASVGKLPDAVHAATMALEHIPPPAVAERAAVLAERGLYHRRNGTASAAADDWQAALALVPGRTDAALGLARLWTLGPEEFRNPARALPLAVLAADGKPETEVVLAAAYLRSGRPRDAATALARCPNGDGGPFAPVVRVLVKKALGEPSAESLAAARAEFERAAPRLDLPTAEDVRRLLAEAGRE